ncbi:NAD(P)-binding protein [Lophiostoma macrostomum CBS 122681]|uniref:NAD(P)-binding protein n=1 Tax=Lophiostoma macrostomum CBS 122681 TaxID=1314788 RepID=A0A6A6TEI2_9PLEO|nr:NAD(P)-binding protein [Lophiostoma macrostomum CBS 122681]
MEAPKILITGATGYIGGSLLTHLLTTSPPSLKTATYTVLLRTASQTSLFAALPVTTHVLSTPDSLAELRALASNFDVIVNPAYATDPGASRALTLGLGDRLKEREREDSGSGKSAQGAVVPHIIQTSGTSNLSDRPHSNPTLFADLGLALETETDATSTRSFTDAPHDQARILHTMRKLEAKEEYPQRSATLAVLDTAKQVGVRATVLMSPTIFGPGTGPGKTASIQIPMLVRAVRRSGVARVVGQGGEQWDAIGIRDLVGVYEGVLGRVVSGEGEAVGGDVLFTTTTRFSWRELVGRVVDAGTSLGYLKAEEGKRVEVKGVELKEFTKWLGLEGMEGFVELGFASNARTSGEVARGWGWKGEDGLEDGIERDWKMIADAEGW